MLIKCVSALLNAYIATHRTAFYAAVRLLVDIRRECAARKINFADVWHTSGDIYRKEEDNP